MHDRAVLKENEVFLVSDPSGDILPRTAEGHGLYWRDTRFLSLYELTLQGTRPTLLSSAGEHNFMNNLQFANAALVTSDGRALGARTISVRRNRFLRAGLHERIGFFNYNSFEVELAVSLAVGSDFRDMFDVRGYTQRARHGTIETPSTVDGGVVLAYVGLDGLRRLTELRFEPDPAQVTVHDPDEGPQIESRDLPGISGHGDPRTEYAVSPPRAVVHFELRIPPKEARAITVLVRPAIGQQRPVGSESRLSLDAMFVAVRDDYRRWESHATEIETDRDRLNQLIRRALVDLRLLSDRMAGGYLPSAGIPWFSVPFGRDALITSMQTLILQPRIAYGTLRFLAEHQGRQRDDWHDEEPGKILHEVRAGEVAALGEVPHTRYYGSVDATPLFLVALGELLQWTGDVEFVQQLRPSLEAALSWLDLYGDADGDGYVEYRSRSTGGIRNQGWKDSADAVAHPDGTPAEPPIALAEVQGYVFAARQQAAAMLRRLGDVTGAAEQERKAGALKARFPNDFWIDEKRFYALALDAEKRPVAVVSSNPGQCLWSGLLDGPAGVRAARRLLEDDMRSGWGIRTLSSRERAFNPMSYHNGSIWPHDNALFAAGMKRLGLDAEASALISEVLEAGMLFPQHRLPELYCGFSRDRRYFSEPAQYPVSCSPQAWASGSVFMMLQSLLGLRVDATERRLTLRPLLPPWVGRVSVRGLHVGRTRVDFEVRRDGRRTFAEIWDSGGLDVAVEPAAAPTQLG